MEVLSRHNKDLKTKFPHIADGLLSLPDETIVDGELVALDEDGRPSFNLLQNFRSAAPSILYFVFDLPLFKGQDLRAKPLSERRQLLKPELVAEVEFLEWTPDNHLRHSRFVALREDKNPRKVVSEG